MEVRVVEPEFLAAARRALHMLRPPHEAERLLAIGRKASSEHVMREYFGRLISGLREEMRYFEPVVSPMEFILGERFLNLRDEIYPRVLEHFCEINSGKYDEAVLTGAIGTAKTTLALWTTAYQLYKLLLYRHPHRAFGLDSSSEILFIFQSLNAAHAKAVDFDRFRHLLLRSPFFNDVQYAFDHTIQSELRFPRRIIVKPVSGSSKAAIGQNVFGGMLDEVNFMAVIDKSKASVDQGTYDQAVELYNSIARRRKSRFMKKGLVPGIFCIVSSKRYPGQFTDKKEEEAKREIEQTGKTSIYVYDKRTWDVLPEDRFSGQWFRVFAGDAARKPRILEDGDDVSGLPEHLIIPIPVEYRREFDTDIINSLRDIAGMSTLARFPFLVNADAVSACFGKVPSVLSTTEVDMKVTRPLIYPSLFRDADMPRFVHIDLGLTGDAAGIACGYVPGFVRVQRTQNDSEPLPRIRLDFTLRVKPPKNDEIQFHKIRALIYKLRELGLNVQWVSYDSYQSVDSIQILRQKNFWTGMSSMDVTPLPYEVTKSAFYDGRVEAPTDAQAVKELISLERDPIKGKIDHPPAGSKDVADAVAGVVYGLTMQKQTWVDHGISLRDIPDSLREQITKAEGKFKTAAGEPMSNQHYVEDMA